MAETNSIVDYLKSTGADSSFSSRTKLAVKQGVVKSANEYVGSASQNLSLLAAIRKGATSTAKPTATSIINQNQDDDIANTPAVDEAPTKSDSRTKRYSTAFSEVSELLNPAGSRPEAPNFSDLYNKTRKDLNIDDLETYVNDLQTEEEQIFADLRARRTDERGKTVATNVIEGRIGQAERQEAERIDYIQRQKATAVRQLQSANATIENIINFTKLDYDTARNSYNDQFTQQMSIFNTVKGIVDSEISDEERDADNARANLTIIYGAIKDGDVDPASVDPAMQYKINQMELSAGLPTGFYENIKNANPDGKILSTTTRTTGGAKYADVLYRNSDGSITSKAVYLGADSTGSGGGSTKDFSEADLERENRSIISNALNKVRGEDGYVSPDDYVAARNKAISSGVYSRETYDKEFAREYVNPNDRATARVDYVFDILDQ